MTELSTNSSQSIANAIINYFKTENWNFEVPETEKCKVRAM